MPLYLVQDSDRPLFIIGRSYQDAVVQWKQVVASENLDDDGRLPDIQDPDGVQKLCDDDDLAGNLLAAQVPDLRVPRSAVRQLVAGHPSDAGWMHAVTHDALVNFLRWADAVRNTQVRHLRRQQIAGQVIVVAQLLYAVGVLNVRQASVIVQVFAGNDLFPLHDGVLIAAADDEQRPIGILNQVQRHGGPQGLSVGGFTARAAHRRRDASRTWRFLIRCRCTPSNQAWARCNAGVGFVASAVLTAKMRLSRMDCERAGRRLGRGSLMRRAPRGW
jgi:uncharacterized membrane protein YidH (DUF202 family)